MNVKSSVLGAALAVVATLSAQNVVDLPEEIVRLDAIVTDAKDRPISDLKAEDVEVVDSGDSRAIEGLTLVEGQGHRVMALFLDDFHVDPGESTSRVRAALHTFIERELRPDDLVAIMKPLDPLNGIQLSSDRAALHAAVDAFEGRKGDYAPRSPFEAQFMSRAPQSADASRAQVATSALQALTQRIGESSEGRKAVIIVSDGFAPALPRGSDRLNGAVRTIVYAANRFSVSIYPISPRIQTSDAEPEQVRTAMLQMLADHTGGTATLNEPDLEKGFKRAVQDLDQHYVVAYRIRRAADGRFHPVTLRVKRDGAHVRVRSGYWSANAALLRAGTTPAPSSFTVRPPHSSPYIRPWIGTSQGPDGKTRVSIVWENGAEPPRNQRVDSVAVRVMGDDGRVVFQERVRASERAIFDVAPGMISVEMNVDTAGGTTIDTDVRGVRVPDLRVSKPTFATTQLMRTRTARAFEELKSDPDAVPTTAREFSRTERILVRVPVYGPEGTTPSVSAQLLNRVGAPMRRLSPIDGPAAAGIVQFDLPLASLAPDEYRVELLATEGGQEAREVVLFRIVN